MLEPLSESVTFSASWQIGMQKIQPRQKSASKNSLVGNRLQKCKHPGGKVPFFHELKSSQNPLPAWVYFHALSFSYLRKSARHDFCRFSADFPNGKCRFPALKPYIEYRKMKNLKNNCDLCFTLCKVFVYSLRVNRHQLP